MIKYTYIHRICSITDHLNCDEYGIEDHEGDEVAHIPYGVPHRNAHVPIGSIELLEESDLDVLPQLA
jgi:hypothetical protein